MTPQKQWVTGYSLEQKQAVLALSEAFLKENSPGGIESMTLDSLAMDLLTEWEEHPFPSLAGLLGNTIGTFLHRDKGQTFILMSREKQNFHGGGATDKNPPANEGTWVGSLVSEDFTGREAPKPMRHNSWVGDLQSVGCNSRSLHTLEPVLHNKRNHGNERPVHRSKEQRLLATARKSPSAAKKTQCNKK